MWRSVLSSKQEVKSCVLCKKLVVNTLKKRLKLFGAEMYEAEVYGAEMSINLAEILGAEMYA